MGIDKFKSILGIRLGFIGIHIVLTTVDNFVEVVYEKNQVAEFSPKDAF